MRRFRVKVKEISSGDTVFNITVNNDIDKIMRCLRSVADLGYDSDAYELTIYTIVENKAEVLFRSADSIVNTLD